jgi:hypothetical protein
LKKKIEKKIWKKKSEKKIFFFPWEKFENENPKTSDMDGPSDGDVGAPKKKTMSKLPQKKKDLREWCEELEEGFIGTLCF